MKNPEMAEHGLHGQVAIVTGGGRGIGAGVAERLARDGAAVAVADMDLPAAAAVAARLRDAGYSARAVAVNIAEPDQVQTMVREAAELGPLSILVNSAGILGRQGLAKDLSLKDWERVMRVNLTGTLLCCQAVIPAMESRGYGRIVNVASIAGKEGNANMAPYSVSKAAVIGLTKVLGKELATVGITVNAIAPSMIETDLVKGMSDEQIRVLLTKIPMGRMGTVTEVAALVRFLVGPESSYLTAQCYDISGGRAVY